MKKALRVLLLFILGMVFAPACFSQNMLMLGGNYNLMRKPEIWSAGLGFNLKLYKEIVQNDFSVNFGGIQAKVLIKNTDEPDDTDETDDTKPVHPVTPVQPVQPIESEAQMKYLFSIRDNLYFNHEWRWFGIRAGAFASFGLYGIRNSLKAYDLFFNAGGMAGICILPKALISITLDASPGYAIAFSYAEGFGINEKGFSLPLSLNIRVNLDKW
jgi:hypothetical protein